MEKNWMNLMRPRSHSNSAITNFFSVRDRYLIAWMGKCAHSSAFLLPYLPATNLKILYLIDSWLQIPPCNFKNFRVVLSYQQSTVV